MSFGTYGNPQIPSYKRAWYTSVVSVVRMGTDPGSATTVVDGAPVFSWEESSDLIDPYWSVPGQMMCRLDLLFVSGNINAPMPAEVGTIIPRQGTVFYDVPTNPRFVRAGDHLVAINGPYTGSTFEIKVIPAPAQGFLGSSHMEAFIVETAIRPGQFPGVTPGSGYS